MLYKGSCHCGRVAFEVEGDLTGAVSCNCSICARKGALLWAVPHLDLHVRAEPVDLGTYLFNRHVLQHRFCRNCGIHVFAEDAAPGADRSAYINIRCLEDIDLAAVPVHEFDGRSM
ncbi:GFA family protein [Inquilinus limosus]|uniref:Aldehyde-activating protein n=1 Tax=Inquilinus limosus MP06 TaxID=1398085 RepID=A0A0A0D094_9PROT|nr:GFA family protein [Inquilinus limosus]KGM31475.1 aldehyde-activating protein [Inquilinus limosus MP06]